MKTILGALFLLGCSGQTTTTPDGGPDGASDAPSFVNHVANPTPSPGGGVGQGAIAGELNVFVIDSFTKLPLANAHVRVGLGTSTTPLIGTTAATGLVTFTDKSLAGGQTITVTMDAGYAASTWVGANGAVVTIPLQPQTVAPASADVDGTIAGWDTITVAPGHYVLAGVAVTQRLPLGSPENSLPQPPPSGFLPANVCAKGSGQTTPCNWKLKVRTGKQMHFAMIADGDSKGTTPTGDDTYAILGYAVLGNLDLTSGQVVTGESLAQVTPSTPATVAFQATPSPLTQATGYPAIDMGDYGLALFALAFTPASLTLNLPALSGAFASGKYNVVATAKPDTAQFPTSTIWRHDTSFAAPFDLGTWLAPPVTPIASGTTFTFTPVAGASVHSGDIHDTNGKSAWNILVLDGSATFTLPTLTPDALPVGANDIVFNAIEIETFDPMNFNVDGVQNKLRRTSNTRGTFVH